MRRPVPGLGGQEAGRPNEAPALLSLLNRGAMCQHHKPLIGGLWAVDAILAKSMAQIGFHGAAHSPSLSLSFSLLPSALLSFFPPRQAFGNAASTLVVKRRLS